MRKLKRFYFDKTNFNNNNIEIAEDFRHITKVMRLNVGDSFIGICDDDYDYIFEITEIFQNNLRAILINKEINLNNPQMQIDMFQAIIKSDKTELIVQKISELGATKFIPVNCEYCIDRSVKNDRLKIIAIEACKQCERSKMLKIETPIDFKSAIEVLKTYDVVIVAYENEENLRLNDLKIDSSQKIACLIGSEGGLSKFEIEELKKINANIISLGKRILRAETASICLLSQLNYKLSD